MQEMIKQIIREELFRNQKQYYFIAGLPRSGASLISAILNQNPSFYSGARSPVLGAMIQLEQFLARDEFFNLSPKPAQANLIIGSVINNWYRDVEQTVIFDRNHNWLNHIPYISGYLDQKPRIICPVRNIDEILASFIREFETAPVITSSGKLNVIDDFLVKNNIPITNDNRCSVFAKAGLLGEAFQALKTAFEAGEDGHLLIVEYDDLVSDPSSTFRKIYDFIEQPSFEHSFTNITSNIKENTELVYGMSNASALRPNIVKNKINTAEILSENIRAVCQDQEFWREKSSRSETNHSQALDINTPSELDLPDTVLIR